MIINEKQNEAQVVGDIQMNRVGIDIRNIDFIATLLTSNLYSKPFTSFLRETISNAYDSHIEAGTKEPIILLIEQKNSYSSTIKVSIRDFGTGISPERFEQIYKNIGSSTKRESNDFIGMFGIGRFSVLSCTNVANITSYYNGVKYSYVMYKNNGGINIDKLNEEKGNFKNGLEVSAEVPSITSKEFNEALYSLSMFRNLHVECNAIGFISGCEAFNKRKVVRKNNLLVCNVLPIGANWFKVGNVLYPCETLTDLYTTGIIIELPMGQVDITPNREALQYSEFTRNTIKTAVKQAKDTLQDLVQKRLKIASLADYYNFTQNYMFDLPLDDSLQLSVRKDDFTYSKFEVYIDGKEIPDEYYQFLTDVSYTYCDPVNIYKILSKGRRWKNGIHMRRLLSGNDRIAIKEDPVIKQVTTQYYRDSLKDRDLVIFTNKGLDNYRSDIAKQLNIRSRSYDIQECMRFTFEHLEVESLSNNSVPSDYIEEFKKRFTSSKVTIRNGIFGIRRYDENGYRNIDYTNFNSFLKYEVPAFAIYDSNTTEHDTLKDVAKMLFNYRVQTKNSAVYPRVITVKKAEIDLLKGRKKFVHINDFLYLRNSFLEKLVTARLILDRFLSISTDYLLRHKRYLEFRNKYRRQLSILSDCSNNKTFSDILEYYTKRSWYNKADMDYFKVSDEDVKILQEIDEIKAHKEDTLEALFYKLYGNKKDLGINLPKSTVYKIIKRL